MAHEFTMHHRKWRQMNGLIDEIHLSTNIHLGPLCSSSCVVVAADDFLRTFHTDAFRNHGTCSYGTWTNNRPHTYCRRPCFPFLLSASLRVSERWPRNRFRFFGDYTAFFLFSWLEGLQVMKINFQFWFLVVVSYARNGNSSGWQTLLCFHWVSALAAGST